MWSQLLLVKPKRSVLLGLVVLLVSSLLIAPLAGAMAPPQPARTWVGAWAAPAVHGNFPTTVDQTFRMILRPTIEGTSVKVRLSHRFGRFPVVLRSVSIARRTQGAAVDPASVRPVTFGGLADVALPAGGDVTSDPVEFPYDYGDDLAVSFYAPGLTGPLTGHGPGAAVTTSYLTPAGSGDHARAAEGTAFTEITEARYFVEALEALVPGGKGTVVAFGDSITDGASSTLDGNDTWPELLAARLHASGLKYGVVNAGIAGNTVIACPPAETGFGRPAVDRFASDALRFPNVRSVVFMEGGNDLRYCPDRTAPDVIAGVEQVMSTARAARVGLLLGTYPPRVSRVGEPDAWRAGLADGERIRLNDWIRTQAGVPVVDFDQALRDPANPGVLDPERTGTTDGVHPGPPGLRIMAELIPLDRLPA